MGSPVDLEKRDLLKFFYERSKDEIGFLRERQDRIFTWASTVISLFITALILTDSAEPPVWQTLGCWGKGIATAFIVLISLFSARWQLRNREWQEENKAVVNYIATLLQAFEPGAFGQDARRLFPERWQLSRKEKHPKGWRSLVELNNISLIYLLGALAVALIWLQD